MDIEEMDDMTVPTPESCWQMIEQEYQDNIEKSYHEGRMKDKGVRKTFKV